MYKCVIEALYSKLHGNSAIKYDIVQLLNCLIRQAADASSTQEFKGPRFARASKCLVLAAWQLPDE